MEIKTSIFWRNAREKKTGRQTTDGEADTFKVKGSWVYRIRYVDRDGIARTVERSGFPKNSKNHCRDEMQEHVKKIESTAGEIRTGERMTFDQLANICEDEFYKPAVIRAGQKIAGIRSSEKVKGHIKNLRAFFGNRRIHSITTQNLFAYREDRMRPQEPKIPGGPVRTIKFATVNRELAAMRRMMRHALGNGWLTRDIFYNAKVIQVGLEQERKRVLSREEETRLLAACTGEWTVPYTRTRKGREEQLTAHFTLNNWHLKAMIILAIDTGMRRGEILKLRWEDVDFDAGYIRIVGTHTKTEKERIAPLSERAKSELEAVRTLSKGIKVFSIGDIKRSFSTAKRLAGITDLRFHDLRATAGDRMSKVYPLSTVAKILGHSQLQTTMKHYVGNEIETVLEVKAWLDRPVPVEDAQLHSEAVN